MLCLVLVAVVASGMLAALAMEPTEATTRADAGGEAKLRDALHLERYEGIRATDHTLGNQPLVCRPSYPKELMPTATAIMAQPTLRTIIAITIPAAPNPTEDLYSNHDRSRRCGGIFASSVGTRASPGGTPNRSPHRRQNLSTKLTAAPQSGQYRPADSAILSILLYP